MWHLNCQPKSEQSQSTRRREIEQIYGGDHGRTLRLFRQGSNGREWVRLSVRGECVANVLNASNNFFFNLYILSCQICSFAKALTPKDFLMLEELNGDLVTTTLSTFSTPASGMAQASTPCHAEQMERGSFDCWPSLGVPFFSSVVRLFSPLALSIDGMLRLAGSATGGKIGATIAMIQRGSLDREVCCNILESSFKKTKVFLSGCLVFRKYKKRFHCEDCHDSGKWNVTTQAMWRTLSWV